MAESCSAERRALWTIACGFEPQRLVVDPDVTVLMLERQKAEMKLVVKQGHEAPVGS